MRIRPKLSLSFSLLFALALLVLAALFYVTFVQLIAPARQELFSLRSQSLAAELDLLLQETGQAVERFALRNPVQTRHSGGEASAAQGRLRARAAEFIEGAPIIRAIGLLDGDGRLRLSAGNWSSGGIDASAGLFQDHFQRTAMRHLLHSDASATRVVVPAAVLEDGVALWVAELELTLVSEHLRDYFGRSDPDVGSVSLIDGERLVLSLSKGGASPPLVADARGMEAALAGSAASPGIDRGDQILFPARLKSVPWLVIYSVPESRYWLGVSELRTKLALALAVILMLAVYVIDFLATRITRPLQELRRASRVSIALDYDSPLSASAGNDEIGDLARTFEIQRRRIGRLINCDELTGAFNRRYFMLALGREVARARRQNLHLCVMMIDADHFKSVNDRHGHACGDAVLVALAKLLKTSVREYDIIGRLGGEEFAVCSAGIEQAAAVDLAERIRAVVAGSRCQCRSGLVGVTVSIGVAEYEPARDLDADALLHRADSALYAAKRNGRDRVEVAGLRAVRDR